MTDDYKVGYGRPPKHSRFRKGRSGNPRGRPKGARNLKTDLAEELAEKIVIREQGAGRKVSKQRALVKSLAAKAIQGDPRATTVLVNMVLKLLADEQDEPVEKAGLPEEDRAILERYRARIVAAAENKTGRNGSEDADDDAE